MNITKQKQIHRYREQTSGYQWAEGRGEGQDRETQISYNITYMWNLKYDTNELIYKIETDSQP